MHPIAEVSKRVIEPILDDLVEQLYDLPDGEEKLELAQRIAVLEDTLLAAVPL
jgi:hypothetical protein